jgi:hypothetical protein
MLHDSGYFGTAALQFAYESLHRAVAIAEVVTFLEIMPDVLSTQPFVYCCFNNVAVRFTGTL